MIEREVIEMGLISKEVEITLSPSSIKYYEELNYNIERRINKYGRLTVPKSDRSHVVL